jgi:aminoglycoside phosphotransferase (APT) family kinase protein
MDTVTDTATDTATGTQVGADPARLRAHLDEHHPGLLTGTPEIELIQGGRSNLTYLVRDGGRAWVLRRPPLGHVPATAHDMGREATVLGALAASDVPVPRIVATCDDPDVLGAPFYLMERVDGTVCRTTEDTRTLDPAAARAVSFALVDVLARLHAVDPEAVGLGGFGRPAGFLQRQVRRWTGQLQDVRGREIPGIDELGRRLAADVPENPTAAIVHGDYRLDNVLVAPDLSVAAVLDWELATLGDPLADLGMLVGYWDGVPGPLRAVVTKGIDPALGFPSSVEIVERYRRRTGSDLGRLSWYVAFGLFKMAVIREGIHVRHQRGDTVGDGFIGVGDLVAPLVEQALTTLGEA